MNLQESEIINVIYALYMWRAELQEEKEHTIKMERFKHLYDARDHKIQELTELIEKIKGQTGVAHDPF